MKHLTIVLLFLIVFACNSSEQRKAAATITPTQLVGKYGEEITPEGTVSVEEMLRRLNKQDSVSLKVEGAITATCAMKGCWMNLVLPGGEEMRVTFRDYGFFVPKEGMEGNKAVIEGVVTKTMTDVETLRHYAEDAGKTAEEIDAITEAREELAFVANGVIIYKESE